MCTSSYIKRFVFQLQGHQLFTTRDLLNFGSRNSIDQTIYRLIKAGIIKRLARGVFSRVDIAFEHIFSVHEIATIKAESFGRKIIIHAKDIAHKLKLAPAGNEETTYATNGGTSSFLYEGKRIHFKKTSAKRMELGDSEIGQVIRGLEYLGKDVCDNKTIGIAFKEILFSLPKKEKLQSSSAQLPAWLVDAFAWYKHRSCVWHGAKKIKSTEKFIPYNLQLNIGTN